MNAVLSARSHARIVLLTSVLAVLSTGCAGPGAVSQAPQPDGPGKYLINPAGTMPIYERWHYAQAARVGQTIWVSGQVGARPDATTIEAQTEIAFERLKAALEAAGSSLEDIVELTSYHTNMADFPKAAAVKDRFIPRHYPAWTAVGTTGLVMPSALIEIKAVAVVGSGKRVAVVGEMPVDTAP
ncbi:MAG: RidA family protein [Pseudomonadota bacterium]